LHQSCWRVAVLAFFETFGRTKSVPLHPSAPFPSLDRCSSL